MIIDGVRYGPIEATLDKAKEKSADGKAPANLWISVSLTEGKNREVRNVLRSLDLHVNRLIRVSYGPFALDDLPVGGVEEIKQNELVAFLKELDEAPKGEAPAPVAGPALRKQWRIATPKPVAKKPPSLLAGEGDTRGARRGEGRGTSAPQKAPVPRYRPDPAPRPKAPAAPKRATATEPAARPAKPAIPKSQRTGWAKAKPKPGRGPRRG